MWNLRLIVRTDLPDETDRAIASIWSRSTVRFAVALCALSSPSESLCRPKHVSAYSCSRDYPQGLQL